VLHRSADKNLVVCDGLFKSPLLSKPIKAKSLLLLQTSFYQESDGTIYATHRADLFVSFPSQTVEAVAKVLSPITVSLTDRTFTEISLFLKMMSMAMARRPDWVEETAAKMDSVSDLRRQQLLSLTAQVYSAAQKQALANAQAAHEKELQAAGGKPAEETSKVKSADAEKEIPLPPAELAEPAKRATPPVAAGERTPRR
jgi:hypothetical protein